MAIEQGAVFDFDFGPRNNHLQEGSRPALVIQCDDLNKLDGYPNVIVVPLTTKQRKSATYIQIDPSRENTLAHTSWAITNQVFTVDKGDLKDSKGRVSKQELYAVKQALKIVLSI